MAIDPTIQVEQSRKNGILQYLDELKQKNLKHESCRTFRDLSRMVTLKNSYQVMNSETIKHVGCINDHKPEYLGNFTIKTFTPQNLPKYCK